MPPRKQALVRSVARWFAAFFWLIRDLPKNTAYKATGANWTIVFMGTEMERIEVEHLFFRDEEVEWQNVGRIALWQLASRAKAWRSEGVDLVICESSRFFPFPAQDTLNFSVPVAIDHMVYLPENAEKVLEGKSKKSKRKRINAATRKGFSYRFSQSSEDYQHFYKEMYLPTVTRRHGDRAIVADQDGWLEDLFRQGGVLLVTEHDQPVAGVVVYRINDTGYSVEGGLLGSDGRLLKLGVNVLLDWYTIVWALEHGASKCDLATSRACLSDGIFYYKSSWGSQITSFGNSHVAWHLYASQLSPALRDHINQIGFITEVKGGHYLVLVEQEDSLTNEMVEQSLTQAKKHRLDGLLIVNSHTKRLIKNSVLMREKTV